MTHRLEGKFEPEARDCLDPLSAAATSMAVSLKRIADALELTQNTVGYSHSVADSIFGIMMNGRG